MTSPLKNLSKRNQARRNRPVVVNIHNGATRRPSGDPRIDLARVQYR